MTNYSETAAIDIKSRYMSSSDEKLKPYSSALPLPVPTFNRICDVAVCLPSSIAKIEACFSTLIMRLQRISMQHERKAHLVLLVFSRDLTKNTNLDEFMIYFASSKHRRLLMLYVAVG